jgi:hypothetical protein
MPHNETFDFEKEAPTTHRSAFTRRFGVHRVLIKAGTELYKLTEFGLIVNGRISPWWNIVEPTNVQLADGRCFLVPGWESSRSAAKSLGVSDEQFGRARSAVTRQWNAMSAVLRVRLNVEAYGWFGRNSGMPLDAEAAEPNKVVLIGGAYQIYVPCLTAPMLTRLG